MKTIVVDLSKTSLREFLANNEVKTGDTLKLFNVENEFCFTLDREFFNLNDPDYIVEDEIDETIFNGEYSKTDFFTLVVKGEKLMNIDNEDNIPVIYGNLSFNDEELYEDLAFITLD